MLRNKRLLLNNTDPLQLIINAFKAKVVSDGGTFYNEAPLKEFLKTLKGNSLYDLASIILTPNATKASTLYSFVGPNLSYTRAGTALRRNLDGVWATELSNIRRLHYPLGNGNPNWLDEGIDIAANYLPNTILANSGGIPTNWGNNISTGSGGSASVTPNGASNFFHSSLNITKYLFSVSGNSGTINALINKSGMAVTVSKEYTQSVWIEAYSGTIKYVDILVNTIPNSSITYWMNGVQKYSTDNVSEIGLLECRFTTTSGATGTYNVIFGAGMYATINGGSGGTASVTLSHPQLEIGKTASSPILNTTSSTSGITRAADQSVTSSLSSYIGQTEGTVYIEYTPKQIIADLLLFAIFDTGGAGSQANSIAVNMTTSGLIQFQVFASSALIYTVYSSAIAFNTPYKIAIAYKSGSSIMYINGIQSGLSKSETFTFSVALAKLSLMNDGYYISPHKAGIQQTNNLTVFPTRLTNSQLAILTT